MKQGISMNELFAEVQRQNHAKKDYLIDSDEIYLSNSPNGTTLGFCSGGNAHTFYVNDNAHAQIAQYLDIPKAYYDKMRREMPDLLVTNVNNWLQRGPFKKRMLRTLDDNVRAFLSERYRRIDNKPLLDAIEPILSKHNDLTVKSCQITDTNLYIKLVNPRLQSEVKVGDIVQSGVLISNSEVGRGNVTVCPLIYRLVCSNGMVAQNRLIGITQRHLGKTAPSEKQIAALAGQATGEDDKELLRRIGETIKIASDKSQFEGFVNQMKRAAVAEMEADLAEKVVEVSSRQFGISKYETEGITNRLMESGDFTIYGLANAVTRHAQDVNSYDRSTELEATGYKIMTMSPALWATIQNISRKEIAV